MGVNPFQHIDLRVNDLDQAVAFYRELLPAVGFEIDEGGQNFRCFAANCGDGPTWFGFTEARDHQPNANRIAFRAANRAGALWWRPTRLTDRRLFACVCLRRCSSTSSDPRRIRSSSTRRLQRRSMWSFANSSACRTCAAR